MDDTERLEFIKNYVARRIDASWLKSLIKGVHKIERLLSPNAFRYHLVERAKKSLKTLVLPEGSDPRVIEAAIKQGRRETARTILLGDPKEVRRIAKQNGLVLNKNVKITNPSLIRKRYVRQLVELRKAKGMTKPLAKEQLKDNIMVGTMMLYNREVDGLVAGAMNTTANTLRPALQIIKTAPGAALVSSVFFMCLPTQVLLYGDCALNPDPNAEELADIAIQSAATAINFGITPKIAMISYSTGSSGIGKDVEKVRKATAIVKKKRPDLLVDGPLQYDAAINEEIAKKKTPKSKVAGHANVIIFPDLNTGNTTYKAVQRSADVNVIGPVMQGFKKPVNDLSRGAAVSEIGFTIVVTAIQAMDGNSSSS